MTTPDERYRALLNVEPRLLAILNTKGPVRKTELRRTVAAILRHYPTQHELKMIAIKDSTGLL